MVEKKITDEIHNNNNNTNNNLLLAEEENTIKDIATIGKKEH